MTQGQLGNIVLWWYGSMWLCKNDEKWPVTEKYERKQSTKNVPEVKSVQLATTVIEDLPLFKKYSSLDKIMCITLYWLRFRNFSVKKSKRSYLAFKCGKIPFINKTGIVRVGGRLKNAVA